MKLLLHTCCAPCIAAPLPVLRADGAEVTGFFYNPNIHPLLEFRKRLRAVEVFAERERLPVIYDRRYGLRDFLRRITPDTPDRCRVCYRMRLNSAARAARAGGFDAFTSSLLFSRHQLHDDIRRIAEDAAQNEGVRFYYKDLRSLVDESQAIARKLSLYRQQYCGCIFSEYDRYATPDDRAAEGSQE